MKTKIILKHIFFKQINQAKQKQEREKKKPSFCEIYAQKPSYFT